MKRITTALIFFIYVLGLSPIAYAQEVKSASEVEVDPCAKVEHFGDRGRCYERWVAEATDAVDNIFGQLIGDKGKELGVNSREKAALRRYYQAYDRDVFVRCRKLEYHCKRSAATEAYVSFIRFTRDKIRENERYDKTKKKTKPYPDLDKYLKRERK